MANSLVEMFRMKDLRKKIFFTLLLLVISRVGAVIPIPGIDPEVLKLYFLAQSNSTNIGLTEYLNFFSGGAFSNFSLFMLGVMPYITTQIIVQLLMLVIPSMKKLAEDPNGKKKIQRYTRYGSIIVCLIQSYVVTVYAKSIPGVMTVGIVPFTLIAMLTVTTGSMFLVWLGEKITQFGVGNGISLLIFAGIVSRWGNVITTARTMITNAMNGEIKYFILIPVILILALAAIVFVVILTNAERRIPVQYAKRVVGRKMYGGQSSHIPLKVNMSGVMPIIFASALLSIPGTIASFIQTDSPIWQGFFSVFNYNSLLYAVLYLLLILAFNYFYVAIQYNPVEIANNLRKNNGAIPGIRPGKPTSDFITKCLSKITFVGAIFLGVIAVMPIILGNVAGMNIQLGGTSLLIVVGVALDTGRSMESYMLMRHHKGFLE